MDNHITREEHEAVVDGLTEIVRHLVREVGELRREQRRKDGMEDDRHRGQSIDAVFQRIRKATDDGRAAAFAGSISKITEHLTQGSAPSSPKRRRGSGGS